MAMTKKEQAEMEALRDALAKAKALSWPIYRPDVVDTENPPPELRRKKLPCGSMRDHVAAWTFNVYSSMVESGGFCEVSHFTGSGSSWSQRKGGPWYRTKRDALMALRIAKTARCAEELAAIDRRIEAEPD